MLSLFFYLQGMALQILESAGPRYIDRIQSVLVDALLDDSPQLYEGQNTCSQSLLKAQEWGFHVAMSPLEFCAQAANNRNMMHGPGASLHQREINIFFARDPLRWRPACHQNSNGLYIVTEEEDYHIIGLPNQIHRCDRSICPLGSELKCNEGGQCSYANSWVHSHYNTRSERAACLCPLSW